MFSFFFVCFEFILPITHFASKSHHWKGSVGKEMIQCEVFILLIIWASVCGASCSMVGVIFSLLISRMGAFCVVKCLPIYKKLTFIRKSPKGVQDSDFKCITLSLVTLWDLLIQEKRCVFIYLHCWQYKAMLCGRCVCFYTVCCGMAGLDTMRNKKLPKTDF